MISSEIICYSSDIHVLYDLKYGIAQITGESAPLFSTSIEHVLFDRVHSEKLKNETSSLIIIGIDSTKDPVELIRQLLKINSESMIIVTGDSHILIKIQTENPDNLRLHYLPVPFSQDKFELMVKMTFSTLKNLDRLIDFENKNVQIEEKVNESLQKLIDANMAKDQFLSVIAHDLKSPFHSMMGVSEILLNNWNDLEEAYKLELIEDIRRTSMDTFKLLNNLLDWTRGQKEKLKINIKEVNIKELVDSALRISQNHVRVKEIKVRNEISGDLKVNTDENMIATVFRNLISNAVQYVQPGGKINISAQEEEECTTFCIADNGQGIEKNHILEFFKKENSKKTNGSASAFKGLGLLICKDFVEKNGGKIWLETQKGEGSKFYFTLPC